ncbi:hypothetical protein L6452_37839 [Arctium lappa]|uniref:Uncharacterized protein n=1 Tax=Arctium lappa TaxID=4217 RepID=A0ACB8Y3B3_ARCLA|nr:hypothetical protein L6452_37839 [Arctium lappa]
MSISWVLLLSLLLSVAYVAYAETHYHEFKVQELAARRLCRNHRVVTVNGQFPGPTLEVQNGDSLVVKVTNAAPYNVTIHWHGANGGIERLSVSYDKRYSLAQPRTFPMRSRLTGNLVIFLDVLPKVLRNLRFVADNPGVWFMHCHIDTHLAWGFAMGFIVQNGVGESQTLLPPPSDLPQC